MVVLMSHYVMDCFTCVKLVSTISMHLEHIIPEHR